MQLCMMNVQEQAMKAAPGSLTFVCTCTGPALEGLGLESHGDLTPRRPRDNEKDGNKYH